MKPLPLLLLTALWPVAAALTAQHSLLWRVETPRGSNTVGAAAAGGAEALPASVLVSLGAEVGFGGSGLTVAVGAHRAELRMGDSVAVVDGAARRIGGVVTQERGVVHLPIGFFVEVLPAMAGGSFSVDLPARTLRGSLPPVRTAVAPSAPARVEPTPPSAAPPVRRLVVVDAGHGGRDPGARGPGGTREKDVTLRIARQLAAILREDPTLEVRMTRDRDTLIALHDRARMANRWRDDGQPAVFISIHCNANESRSERGFETYFLADARTADARRVEAFENAAMQYEDAPPPGDLGFILTDLRQNQYLRESSGWAQMIQDRLRTIHPGPNRGVKQAGFAVLRGTFMPAVLVEIGFVSNAAEERMLTREEVQADMARQLARGVRDFFARAQARPQTAAN